jgi:lysophospholipase L1-like esterase
MPSRSHRRLAQSGAGLVAALVIVGGQGHAIGAAPEYVALGDSYASGLGTREYYIRSGTCLRSPHAYPVTSATRLGADLTFRACSRATIDDVSGQLRALDAATRYVSVQVGGNDAGFTRVISECAKPAWMQDCAGAVRSARRFINRRLPEGLAGLYARIKRRSPSASVVAVGYPRLFHDEDCNAGTWFSPADRTLLNDAADLLNQRIHAQARASGFAFANPTRAFLGHAICDSPEWVNGLSSPITESYHPNRAGQHRYARLVTRRLR